MSKSLINKEINIDKKYIKQILKVLISKGFVSKDKGKYGKYFPTINLKENYAQELSLYIQAVGKFVDVKGEYIGRKIEKEKYVGLNGSQGFKRLIPIFSKSIGAIITYLIIESMDYSNHITDGAKSNIERDFLVWKWVSDVISGLSMFFLESLRFAIYDVINLEEMRQKYFNNDATVGNEILESYTPRLYS